ncbi:unnamed protein product [Paramecium sonneborni]|uniref:Uncharacterized protein n=1 Tax=Paramecium sonneborni TaxID=65129 RepID=A0A8S1KUT5_9CILI|nr:unnamed protein product [Paramecium sonneborni]
MNINEQLLQILTDICSVLRSAVTKELSTQEILNALKLHIFTLLELVSQSKNLEYDELEKAVQKAEAEIRFHIRLEQQMRLYADNLQEKIEQLEFEKQKQNEKKSQNQFQQREGSPNEKVFHQKTICLIKIIIILSTILLQIEK